MLPGESWSLRDVQRLVAFSRVLYPLMGSAFAPGVCRSDLLLHRECAGVGPESIESKFSLS